MDKDHIMTATEIADRWREYEKRHNAAVAKMLEPIINKMLEMLKRHG